MLENLLQRTYFLYGFGYLNGRDDNSHMSHRNRKQMIITIITNSNYDYIKHGGVNCSC